MLFAMLPGSDWPARQGLMLRLAMRPAGLENDSRKTSAPVILQVAKAISAHLELPDVLEALIATLKPLVQFDSIAICVKDGEFAKLHSLHIEGLQRKGHESPQSMLERKASDLNIEPLQTRIAIHEHPMSEVMRSREPYVCTDVETQRRFPRDDDFLKYGIRSYVTLPLMKHGELIGVVDFLSLQRRSFAPDEVQLLQDVSDMVSIAVSNALAYEQINILKEQLQVENRLLRDEIVQRSIYEEIVGSSPSLQNVLAAIDKVAGTDSTVLVTGETGTGKELVATITTAGRAYE